MESCSHERFESLVRVGVVTPTTGSPPYHQASVQIRCTACQAPLTWGALPAYQPGLFMPVAAGAGGTEVVLSGVVVPPMPPMDGQAWTPVVMPAVVAADAPAAQ